jgi:DNA (cytosine-5)-methyltransferase 1
MNELALFAGAGGGILGGKLLGWNTVGAVEIEEYPRNVLLQRQRDGILRPFPIWDDVTTFDGRPWRGLVDVVSGGFPCQDISVAGKGAGITGARSGLWGEMFRIICEIRPRFAFMENSPMLTVRGLGNVLGDLASVGFAAEWLVLGASDVGAPHRRERIWILATPHTSTDPGRNVVDTDGFGRYALGDVAQNLSGAIQKTPERESCGAISTPDDFPDADMPRRRRRCSFSGAVDYCSAERSAKNAWWLSEPGLGRVADGVAHKMDRLRAIGNGQVPLVAAVAFNELKRRLMS